MAKGPASSPLASDAHAINLSRLLERLKSNLLSEDASAQLPRTSYERAKVRANLEYARTLFLRLEQETSNIKIHSRRQSALSDLQQKRELIKALNNRLYELDQMDDELEDDSNAEEDVESEKSAPVVPDSSDTINSERRLSKDEQQTANSAAATPSATSELRARRPQPTADQDTGITSSASLFPSNPMRNPTADPTTARTETLLDHSRNEQEVLTESLLEMAKRLRMSTVAFQASLDDSNDVLGRAGEGLEKNTSGMSAAGKRMSDLRRMAEGRGWLGRLQLYAYLFGIIVVVTLLVFLGPKIRL